MKKNIFFIILFVSVFFQAAVSQSLAEDTSLDIDKMSYEQLIELALQNNPALKAVKEGLPLYAARIKETKTAKEWSLSYVTSVTYNGIVPKTAGMTIPLVPVPIVIPESSIYAHDIYDIKFQLQKPLYTGGRVESLVKQSVVQSKLQEQEYEKTRQQVIFQVKEAYFSVLKTYELLKIANEKISQLQEHLNMAQKRLKNGVSTKFEVLTAEVKLVQAKQNAAALDNQLKITKEALNHALGLELTYEQIDVYVSKVEATRRSSLSLDARALVRHSALSGERGSQHQCLPQSAGRQRRERL